MSQKRQRRVRAERTALAALSLTRYIGQLFTADDLHTLTTVAKDRTDEYGPRLFSLATRLATIIDPGAPNAPPSPDPGVGPRGLPAHDGPRAAALHRRPRHLHPHRAQRLHRRLVLSALVCNLGFP